MNKRLVLFLLYIFTIVVIAICGIRNAEHKRHIANLEQVIEDGHYCVSKCVEMVEEMEEMGVWTCENITE